VAGFTVAQGQNAIALGLAAVCARLENGTLRVLEGACPNLLREADLYRYAEGPREGAGEAPLDEHNHALAALRYLICCLDQRKMARGRQGAAGPVPPTDPAQEAPPRPKAKPWLRPDNPFLWETL
jgi:hypothetical protein